MKAINCLMLIAMLIFLLNNVSAIACYQETTNKSSVTDGSCSLAYTGAYANVSAENITKMYDGNWSSFTYLPTPSIFYSNYTLPGSLNTTGNVLLWQTGIQGYNNTLPAVCLSNALQIKVVGKSVSNGCFPNGQISLANNKTKDISNIKVGDYVLTLNEKTKLIEKKKVLALEKVILNSSDSIMIINENLNVTPNHYILINNNWTLAMNVKIGDFYTDEKGYLNKVKSIRFMQLKEITPVYSFLVEDNHNYFVNGMLVHNGPPGGGGGVSTQATTDGSASYCWDYTNGVWNLLQESQSNQFYEEAIFWNILPTGENFVLNSPSGFYDSLSNIFLSESIANTQNLDKCWFNVTRGANNIPEINNTFIANCANTTLSVSTDNDFYRVNACINYTGSVTSNYSGIFEFNNNATSGDNGVDVSSQHVMFNVTIGKNTNKSGNFIPSTIRLFGRYTTGTGTFSVSIYNVTSTGSDGTLLFSSSVATNTLPSGTNQWFSLTLTNQTFNESLINNTQYHVVIAQVSAGASRIGYTTSGYKGGEFYLGTPNPPWLLSVSTAQSGMFELYGNLTNVTTSLLDSCKSSLFFVSIPTIINSTTIVGGAGGGAPIVGNASWLMKTSGGSEIYNLLMASNEIRIKEILFKNIYLDEVRIDLECQGDACKFITFENKTIMIPANSQETVKTRFRIDLTNVTNYSKYSANIIGRDATGDGRFINVNIEVGNIGVIFSLVNKLSANLEFAGIKIPYAIISFFTGLIVFVVVNFLLSKKTQIAPAVAFIFAVISALTILLFV